jgi:hypothetical protein
MVFARVSEDFSLVCQEAEGHCGLRETVSAKLSFSEKTVEIAL